MEGQDQGLVKSIIGNLINRSSLKGYGKDCFGVNLNQPRESGVVMSPGCKGPSWYKLQGVREKNLGSRVSRTDT